MTGMKEGAGEDPFAEDSGSSSAESGTTGPAEPAESDTASSVDQQPSMQIPYKFRRDGVQDGRDRVPLFLQKETKDAERDALREFEDQFDDNVSLTDVREALVMVGLNHLDEVEEQMEEWGYGMTFD